MSAELDLQTLLAGNTGVTSLVGGRIGADRAEQDWGRPFVIYTRTDTERFKTLDGTVVDEKVTFDVQCWADTRAEAEACADACTAAIEGGDHGEVVGRSTSYDGDLDLEATLLTVEWWQ